MPVVGSTLQIVPASPTLSAPAFGAWLTELRGERSLEQIARKLRPLVDLEVPASLIHKIERGRVPSWAMLAAFSQVYEQPLDLMTLRLMRALTTAAGVPLAPASERVPQPKQARPTLSLDAPRPSTSAHALTGRDSSTIQLLTGRRAKLRMVLP